jgi:TRL-like protein family
MTFMKLKLAAGALALLASTGCAVATGGTTFATGSIYAEYKSGGEVGTAQAAKVGEACVKSILGAIALGDASIEAAKKAGGITQIAHVDHEQFSILGVYATSCTIVHGQ